MASSAIKGQISLAMTAFKFDDAAMRAVLTGPHAAVARDLVRRAIRVEAAAKQNASGRPGPNVQTGRLRGSITWRLGADMRGPYVDVGSAVEYARFVEEGTSRMPPYPYLRPALNAARL